MGDFVGPVANFNRKFGGFDFLSYFCTLFILLMLKGKKIVLGITGSIAAYKSCLIIRELVKRGAEVQVVITPAGKEFITPIDAEAGHQRVLLATRRHVALACESWPVGRCHADSSLYGFDAG